MNSMTKEAMAVQNAGDIDPSETREWLDAIDGLVRSNGHERAQFLLKKIEIHAQELGVVTHTGAYSAYRNSIPLESQGGYPGDLVVEERLIAIMRWNALAMVVRANQAYGDLGGHIASYASAAEIFEVGFQHFFKGPDAPGGGDLVYFQPHSAPGIYSRAFMEGRLSEEQLSRYRQEINGGGLCSYPHPWLMPEFWQFPTGSMGIGPMSSIYQARFMRYLENRGLADTSARHVWGVFGDGEMDEPESIGALTLAAREKLDNLTMIINCNLQRLDGPVRGNGQIIQELESLFAGAGWNVIKVLWGSDWDALFARDTDHILLRHLAATVDGQYQTLGANDGAFNITHFFEQDPQIRALVAHMTPDEIDGLKRGGHDFKKLFAAFAAAKAHKGRPTVILAKTKKGYGMGGAGESRMTSHQAKKLDLEALKAFRDRFKLPLTDEAVAALQFFKPEPGSVEMQYLHKQRERLGGSLPARRPRGDSLPIPAIESYAKFALEAEGKEMSTTMAAVRIFGSLLKDSILGPRLVPIVADEARTFGMANMFRQIGIYSPLGQLYEPEDAASMLCYREAKDGQLLEEGITEAGAISSWTAAATSYSVHGISMLPIYIYYSMFGFQRVGDLIWAAADQRARGFLFGATAGRTTLGGEGLQHQDGSSHIMAASIPNCRAYDPAFAGELAVIMDYGMRQMLDRQEDVFYYLTVMNENYAQPTLLESVREDVVKGLYLFKEQNLEKPRARVRLLGSGAIFLEVQKAAQILAEQWQIESELWSVTSFSELARNAREVERDNRQSPERERQISHVQKCLQGTLPIIAATDYVRALPQLISSYLDGRYVALGTDGFGRSDTRSELREFFEVDSKSIVLAALDALVIEGTLERSVLTDAIQRLGIDTGMAAPWNC